MTKRNEKQGESGEGKMASKCAEMKTAKPETWTMHGDSMSEELPR